MVHGRIVSVVRGIVIALSILTACTARADESNFVVPVADAPYSFVRAPFVHPRIVEDLSTWLSDAGDQVVAINLVDSQNSNRYFGAVGVVEAEGQCPYVYWDDPDETGVRFGYRYVGMTDSGVHVLSTSSGGGGSGRFVNLMLFTIEFDSGIVCCDWDRQTTIKADKKRVVMRKLGEIGVGDRWSGELRIVGNDLHVGWDEGWFAESGGMGGGWLSSNQAARVLTINIQPTGALDLAQSRCRHDSAAGETSVPNANGREPNVNVQGRD